MPRYIDANLMKEEIDKWLNIVGYCTIGKGLSYYGELLGCIDDTPTADVVEVRHGKWIDDGWGDYIKVCSCCGELPLAEPDGEPSYSRFCPHCGARMDGE